MTTYLADISRDGQTEDQWWFDSRLCMEEFLEGSLGGSTRETVPEAGAYRTAEGFTVTYGAWPGGSETDYDVLCETCGELMWHGLEVTR